MKSKNVKNIPFSNTVYIASENLPTDVGVKSVMYDLSDLYLIFHNKISLVFNAYDETLTLFKYIIELVSEITDMQKEFIADGYIEIMAVTLQDYFSKEAESVNEGVDMYMLVYDNEQLIYNICENWLKLRNHTACTPYYWSFTRNNKFNTNHALLDLNLMCVIK